VPLLVIAPLVGIAIVPVTPPVGVGLTPSDVTSVAPSGIPVVPTDPLVPIPSGEVMPSEGTAVSGSSGSSTWANAGPAHNRHHAVKSGRTAAIADDLIGTLLWKPASLQRKRRPGTRSCDIGQSWLVRCQPWHVEDGRSACEGYAVPGSKRLRTISRFRVAGPSQLLN
jgi:hypothetical protein